MTGRSAFLWGVATAGHQVEGNNLNADIWLLEQVRNTRFAEASGDACDSLHRWREDIAIAADPGLNCFGDRWDFSPTAKPSAQVYAHEVRIRR